ncbi:uncharacterized protein BXZ73DRAFT_104208 [Epithele typhae]|uniref:uncharacterized protein n=1 Tax=Epithele typhae TaxID=378194 RepID=UPI002008AF21|nr:uncharacterized protein BXZ73DRAFT_104208 [Epithele typhae]KAH9921946.1 hypothetical protein BXZ73DRAFT_104208 [Epithele typhae]
MNDGRPSVGEKESDGEEDNGDGPRPEETSEHAQRLEQAGQYKHMNTLLHDLHAEQRHRMLFSSPLPPSYNPALHNLYESNPTHHLEPLEPLSKLGPSVPAYSQPNVPREPHKPLSSFHISISSKDDTRNHTEEQRVTELYEGRNRFLGELFLNRRRQYYQESET